TARHQVRRADGRPAAGSAHQRRCRVHRARSRHAVSEPHRGPTTDARRIPNALRRAQRAGVRRGRAGVMLDARAITRGLVIGVVLIAPISIGVKLLRDHTAFDGGWLAIPFIAILAAYVLAGVVAGRAGPHAPLSNGALAALLAFAAYLVVRIAVPLLLGNDVDLPANSIVLNALLPPPFPRPPRP